MRSIFFTMIVMGLLATACGSGEATKEETPRDTQMVAEHVDPSAKSVAEKVQPDVLKTDPDFVQNAVETSEDLAGLADIAIKKATNAEVKQVAQAIAKDQRSWITGLKLLNKKLTNAAPKYTDNSREELEKLTGSAFDKQWVEKMNGKYTALISRYETEKEASKDKAVVKLVGETLPVMKTHQQQLEACRNKL